MRVDFRKIDRSALKFRQQQEDLLFEGTLQRYDKNLILLQAHLGGKLAVACDLCAAEMTLPIDESIEFFVSDGMYKPTGDEEHDIVEFFDGSVDVEALLHSEIELLKSGYYICKDCKQ